MDKAVRHGPAGQEGRKLSAVAAVAAAASHRGTARRRRSSGCAPVREETRACAGRAKSAIAHATATGVARAEVAWKHLCARARDARHVVRVSRGLLELVLDLVGPLGARVAHLGRVLLRGGVPPGIKVQNPERKSEPLIRMIVVERTLLSLRGIRHGRPPAVRGNLGRACPGTPC